MENSNKYLIQHGGKLGISLNRAFVKWKDRNEKIIIHHLGSESVLSEP